MCKRVTIVTRLQAPKKEAASSRPGGITWMRPFLSAQLHLLPMNGRCPDYEGVQHCWEQPSVWPGNRNVRVTNTRQADAFPVQPCRRELPLKAVPGIPRSSCAGPETTC